MGTTHHATSNEVTTAMTDNNEQLAEPLLPSHHQPQDPDNDDDAPTFSGLLYYRALFFLSGLSASTWGRFGIIFYNTVAGLSPVQIGVLQGVVPILSTVAMPFWGAVADWCHSRKRVYLGTSVWGSASLLSLAVVPHGFYWILPSVCGMALFTSSGVLDAHLLDYLGDRHRGMYGTVRLWTAVSWGLGAIIMGWITDLFGFEWNFILYGCMSAVMLSVVAFGLPARSKNELERYERPLNEDTTDRDADSGALPRHPRPEVLYHALVQIPVLIWLLEVVLIGSGMAVVESFLFVYLQNDLDASTKLCGSTVGVTVLFELPIFHFSKPLLKRAGHDALFAIAMLSYIVRVFGYTVLSESTVHWVLVLEALHGITFACMWIASIDFSAAAAPAEWSTTFQTILTVCFSRVGNVLGALGGGWIMEHYSAIDMYRGMGSIVTVTLILHLFMWLVFGRGHDAFLECQSETSNAQQALVAEDSPEQINSDVCAEEEQQNSIDAIS